MTTETQVANLSDINWANLGALTLTGDVTGASANGTVPTVVAALQGIAVSSTAPTNGQYLVYNSGTSKWTPTTTSFMSSALTSAHLFVGNGSNVATDVALSGDATLANTGALTIAANAVTYAKIQNVTASSLLGNPTGSPAAPSEISLGATLAFSGTALQTAALTGDVTASANSFATTIAANAVTYAKFQQVAASSLVGNATGSLANATGITLGATLAFSGSALQTAALTGDVTAGANSFVTTVAKIGGQSVSLAGSFTMSGAHTFTGTLTADTSVTFPTSGTLMKNDFSNSAAGALASGTTATTQSVGDNSTKVATTAFVQAANPNLPYLSVQLNNTQSVTSATWTKVAYDTVNEDSGSYWDATNHRFTPGVAGLYQVTVTVQGTGTTVSILGAAVYRNGARYPYSYQYPTTTATGSTAGITFFIRLNGSTDYIEGWGFVTAVSGAAFDTGPGTPATPTTMTIHRIGA